MPCPFCSFNTKCAAEGEELIRHCSQTLAGMKTGSIYSRTFCSKEQLCSYVSSLNKTLGKKGVRVLPLNFTENGRALIYVYRPKKLKADFESCEVCNLLERYGYESENPTRCVTRLIGKCKSSDSFPHEIGLFLGYPPEDVSGFIENKAEKSKLCGFWKVYGDVEEARKTFCKYKKCADVYYRLWKGGKSLFQLTVG